MRTGFGWAQSRAVRRWLPVTLVAALLALLPASPAPALTVTPMNLSYNATVNGDYRMIGNGILNCDPARPTLPGATFTCANLHSGTAGTNFVNDFKWMGQIDVDGDAATANSSRATVTIPAGAVVEKAILYWSGNTSLTKNTNGTTRANACGTNNIPAGNDYIVPAGSPSTRNLVVNFGATTFNVAPTNYAEETLASLPNGQPQYYSAQADVSAQFAALPTGSAQTITVGNLWAMQGYGCYAGWSLALVYDFGAFDPLNAANTGAREVFLYDGHVRKFAADPAPEVVPVSGFIVQAAGSRGGMTLHEGDRNITGDFATYQSNTAGSATQIQNAIGGLNNIGVSNADGSIGYGSGAAASPFFNSNTDVRNLTLTGLATGDTSMNFSLDTTGDSYLMQNLVLSVPSAAVRIDKRYQGNLDEQTVAVGQSPTFTIRVENAGSVPLRNLVITDPLAPDCNRTIPGPLAPAAAPNSVITYTCTGLPATEAFVNEISIDSRTDLGGSFGDSDTSVVHVPRIDVQKSAAPTIVNPGGSTTWTIVVTNIGDEPLSNVATSDPLVPDCNRANLGTLAPGASTTYTCTSTNITTGFTNTVNAVGNSPAGVGAQATDSANADVRVRNVSITKSAAPTSLTAPGQNVTYSFVVRNTGEVPLSNVAVTDTMTAPAGPNPTVTCPSPNLAVGAQMTCTATYTATLADANLGTITNNSAVNATDANGGATSATSNQVVVPINATPALTLVKSAAPTNYTTGSTVTYTFRATNVGQQSLNNVSITDTGLTGLSALSCTPTAPATLAPGAVLTCTATKTFNQAEADAGAVTNTARATGTPAAGGPAINAADDETVTSTAVAAVDMVKTASPLTYVAGTLVTYTFRTTNTGTKTLNNVSITDTGLAGLSPLSCTPGAPAILAPGAVMTCTATKTMTQAEADAGAVTNTATVNATPSGAGTPLTDTDGETVTSSAVGAIDLTKTASPATYVAGDVVTYTFTTTNTGTKTLNNVSVTDTGLTGLSALTCTPAAPATLAPGAVMSCSATKTMTQAEADAGAVINTARSAGTPAGGGAPVADTDNETVTSAATPAIDLVKSASPSTYLAGDVVTYTFTTTNTGTRTLNGVSVTDTGLTGLSALTCTPGTLAPGAAQVCTATKTMTQADADAGAVTNTATSQGTPVGGGGPITDTDGETVTSAAAPALELVKSANPGVYVAGDVVTYTFTTTNTGSTTLSNVAVTDSGLTGLSALSCTPAAPATLAPGAAQTCTGTKTMTQAEADAGAVTNTATATGTPPGGGAPVGDADDETVVSNGSAALSLSKTAAPTSYVAGDVVTYTFVTTNTGTLSLTGVFVVDTGLTGVSPLTCVPASPTTLAPGEVQTCTATKTMTQADVDAGSVTNSATSQGTPPGGGDPVTITDDETVTSAGQAGITLEKSATPREFLAGDEVTYDFFTTNSGTLSLTNVSVTDTGLVGLSPLVCTPAAPATLAPGETQTCTATKTMTQAEADSGAVTNNATNSGTPAIGDPVTGGDDETVTSSASPSLVLSKTANPTTYGLGDVVTYTFTSTNNGTQTLSDVTISDSGLTGLSPLTCTPAAPATLAPGEVLSCTATKTMTQADVDAGSVINTATSTGTPPGGADPVETTDDETVTSDGEAALTFAKTADPTTYVADDVVTYTFTTTNSGTVTLSDVAVTDTGLTGLSPLSCTPAAPATLAPGEAQVCTATKTMTQADTDAGSVINTATATGTPPGGADPIELTDDETVTSSGTPVLTLNKSASPRTYVAGDVVTYTFFAANEGTVTLTDVSITDTGLAGLSALDCIPAAPATLAPGEALQCSATKTMTQAETDAGAVTNVATTTGTPPGGADPVTGTDDETVTSSGTSVLTLAKSASQSTYLAGDVVTYTFVTTNGGTKTLTDVEVTDTGLTGLSALDCTPAAPATLAPGESQTCTATKTMTQAEADAGSVTNTATATGTPPGGAPPLDATDDETITSVAAPALTLDKSAAPATYVAGDVVTYTFTTTNSGTTTLSGVEVSDTGLMGLSALDCTPAAPATLAPGEVLSCTATKTMTQAEADAGSVTNTATVTGTPPGGGDPVDTTDDETVTSDATPSLALTKAASPLTYLAGDVVTYTFTATNDGTATLTDVEVSDSGLTALSALDCTPAAPATLAPGEVLTCTATKTMTQAEADAGAVTNTATATGTPPGGADPVTATDDETVTSDATPSITLDKSAAPTTYLAGDVVTYTFVTTNNGTNTLSGVEVSDTGLTGLSALDCTPAAPATLAPGETQTCTATKTMTQAEADAGLVTNTATTTGTPPGGAAPVTATDDETVTSIATPALELAKSAAPLTYLAGDVVTYTFTATNTGTTTLSAVEVSDSGLTGLSALDCTPAAPATLAPGEVLTCTATKTMTQAEADAGAVTNTATATGTPPGGADPVTATDDETVTSDATPSITLDKSAAPTTYLAGDVVTYTFVTTNNGTNTLSAVEVSDSGLTGLSALDCTPAAPATLAPGETQTCTATKTMTQAEADAGLVTNTATTTGTPPGGAAPVTATDDETVTSIATPALELAKSAAPLTYLAGDVVTYTFTATNTGTTTLSAVEVSDSGLTGLSALDCTPAAPATLAPGEVLTCTATKTMTQAEADAGAVTNTATATGTPPGGADPVTATDDETVTSDATPSITLDKSAAPTTYLAGDVVTYTFVTTNTGTLTLSDVEVDDTGLVGLSALDCTPAAPATLAPGETQTCTATKTMTQAETDAGLVTNTATTTGTPPGGAAPVTATDDETVTSDGTPGLALAKSADPLSYVAGDVVTYTFTATNTGTLTLAGVEVSDSGLTGLSALDCTPAAPATLAPGEVLTCTATKTMTQAETDAGAVTNTATATGTPPGGADPVTATDDETVTSDGVSGISLDKSASPATYLAGDEVTYTFVTTNTGTLTLSDVEVDDTGLVGLSALDCTPAAPATLAPGETQTCTATKTMTQAETDAGLVTNTATTTGTPPGGAAPVTATDDETVTSSGVGSIELAKSADPLTYLAGDVVTYTFLATNTGTLTLTDVEIADTGLTGLSALDCTPAAPATLAPGEVLTCTATKTMTQAETDAGAVTNTATATGTPPPNAPGGGAPVTGTDDETVTSDGVPGIAFEKTADPATYVAGDEVTYTFVTTNTGTLTLSDVEVADTGLTGLSALDCTPAAPATLAPGETHTCTATKTMTQAETDAGSVTNTATTTGTPPGGADPVTATDDETVLSAAEAGIGLEKSVSPETYEAGDVVTYTFVATNTRGLTLSDVIIEDTGVTGLSALDCIPAAPATLAPGEALTCTATKTMTQAETDAGAVTNTATAAGLPPGCDNEAEGEGNGRPAVRAVACAVTASDDATATSRAVGGVSLQKFANLKDKNGNDKADAGEVIAYSFEVTNTGGLTLTDVTVNDPMLGGDIACVPSTLAPGQVATCGPINYTVTSADVDRGEIVNTATASGNDGRPGTDNPTGGAETTTPTGPIPDIPATGGPVIPETGATTAMTTNALLGAGLLLTGGMFMAVGRRRRKKA